MRASPKGTRRIASRGQNLPENGGREVRVLLSTYESRGGVEPLVGLVAAQFGKLAAALRDVMPWWRPA